MGNRFPLFLLVFLVAACSGRRPVESQSPADASSSDEQPAQEEASLPENTTPAMGPSYRVIYDQAGAFQEPVSNFDVLHTTLDLNFDLAGERVIGTAIHRLTPTVDALDRVRLDGRDMQIRSVSLRRPEGDFQEIPFQYNNTDLEIPIAPSVGRTVALELRIDYVAHPTRNGRKLGMVFVDGSESDPSRPTQVWTLGQPEDNQYWFPAWDYPNDRMTFDLSLTVPAKFSTVANGDLVEQTQLVGGMRRDRWVLNKPHASYLTGFVVGEYAGAVDTYTRRDGTTVPLGYLVEPAYINNTQLIFGETAQIMRFLEDRLGIAYPWSNYKQVAVREFTANGMENTSATVLFANIQHDSRAHLDYTGRDLIVHELAHQWIGNLVTCRNWANLPINEGFATYFERLFLEEAHGYAEAQAHTIADRTSYLDEAERFRRPIIWHGYGDPNNMYDRHTYQKAALVLHQLRLELGDDVWWQGVRQFVRENAYRNVVIEDLQRAMQQASGRELTGFFNQWYRRPGHPELEVAHRYEPSRGLYEIQVRQVQDSLRIGNFSFEVDIEVNVAGAEPWLQRYRVASTDTTFRFAIPGGVSFVRFDAGDWVLGKIDVSKADDQWINQLRFDDEPAGRYDAVQALAKKTPTLAIQEALVGALRSDGAVLVREAAAGALASYNTAASVRNQLLSAVQNDGNAAVRRVAMASLAPTRDEPLRQALRRGVQDASYKVAAQAVTLLATHYPNDAVQEMRPLFEVVSWDNTVENAIIGAYSQLTSLEGIPYLQDRLAPQTDEELQVGSLNALSRIARTHPAVQRSIATTILGMLDSPLEPVRFAAVQALEPLRNPEIVSAVQRRLTTESSNRVRQAMTLLAGAQNQ